MVSGRGTRGAGRLVQGDLQLLGDGAGNFVLNLEDVAELAVEGVRPQMHAGRDVDQLSRHANCVLHVVAAHAAFDDRADVQLAANFLNVFVHAFVGERRGARDHLQIANARQHIQQLLGQAVGEQLVFALLAERDKRQHGDGLGVCRRGYWSGRRRSAYRGLCRGRRDRFVPEQIVALQIKQHRNRAQHHDDHHQLGAAANQRLVVEPCPLRIGTHDAAAVEVEKPGQHQGDR